MTEFTGFRPAAFRFFRGLVRNNSKAWFEKNRAVYQLEVLPDSVAVISFGPDRTRATADDVRVTATRR